MLGKILKIKEARAEISDLKEQVEAYKNERSQRDTELAAATDYACQLQGDIAERDLEIKALKDDIEAAKAEIETLEEDALEATAQAAEIVAQIGASEPIPVETEEEKSSDDLLADFNQLKDPAAKVEFYRKHRSRLLNLT